jgi:hypothetical protein
MKCVCAIISSHEHWTRASVPPFHAERQGACGTLHDVGMLTRNECYFRLQSAASSTSSGALATGPTATTAGTTARGTAAMGSASTATRMQRNHPKAEQTRQQQHSVQPASAHGLLHGGGHDIVGMSIAQRIDVQHVDP